jgi:hypothetical protein
LSRENYTYCSSTNTLILSIQINIYL